MPVAVVIDSNVWVSAFLNPGGFPARLILAGKTGNFSIVSRRSTPRAGSMRRLVWDNSFRRAIKGRTRNDRGLQERILDSFDEFMEW